MTDNTDVHTRRTNHVTSASVSEKGRRAAESSTPAKVLKKLMGKMSQSGLSRALQKSGTPVPQATISRILGGAKPEVETARKLAAFFGVPVGQLLGTEFYAPPNPDEPSREARQVANMFDQLPPDLQENYAAILRALIQTHKKTLS